MPTYATTQQVSIVVLAPAGSTIYYTLDGSEPTTSSTVYNPATPLIIASTTTIKAKGYHPVGPAYLPSAVAEVEIIIVSNRVYYGYSPLTVLNEAQLLAISNAPGTNEVITSDCFGTYTFGSGSGVTSYFYFWWPATFSDPAATSGFELVSSGFPVPMAEASQGYTNISANGWGRIPLTVNGVSGYLFRTYHAIGDGTNKDILVQ